MAAPRTAPGADTELTALQQAWPGWKIWRARRSGDPPGGGTGAYMASRMDDSAGEAPTLMEPDAAALDNRLRQQTPKPQ